MRGAEGSTGEGLAGTTLSQLLGVTWPGAAPERVRACGVSDCHGWVLEDLVFDWPGGESAPSYFLRPPDGQGPVPAVVYIHAHGNRYDFGRDELIQGRGALQGPYAPDLVALGVAALCIEMPCFGARQSPGENARAKALLWQGGTLFGQMLAELRAGVDFLGAQPMVRADRIGAMGLSMGCTLAWWLAALDGRIRATSGLCCFADLGALVQGGGHDAHGIYMVVPGLLEVARSGQIAGLVAPRALQFCVGQTDPLTPPDAFAIARGDVAQAYDLAGAPERLSFLVEPDTGHVETPAMRRAVLDFLGRELVGGGAC